MTAIVPAGVLALLAYCLLCLVSPVAKCPRTKVTKRKGKRPRVKTCPKCKGRGHRMRPGARTVHRIAWAAAGDRLKGHFRDRYEERISDAAGHLEDDWRQ